MAVSRAIFLDKDGTLVENVPYNVDPGRIRLTPGAGQALRQLQQDGFQLFVVTNQAGVAHGYFPEEALREVDRRLRRLLGEYSVELSGFFYCPHSPSGRIEAFARDCACRKPEPGLILDAAAQHGVDLGESWLIGDILEDVEAGNRAGCRSLLIDNGLDTYDWPSTPPIRTPRAVFNSLPEAAKYVLGSERSPRRSQLVRSEARNA